MASNAYRENTLEYHAAKCTGCGMCSAVCPHGVFEMDGRVARLANPEACMECGACALNCPSAAIEVDSGVGCAAAMIWAALRGKKTASCGGPGEEEAAAACCGGSTSKPVRSREG